MATYIRWKVSTKGSMLAFETSGRAGADRDTSTCSCDQLCRILGDLNEALHVCIQPFWVILPLLYLRATSLSCCSGSPLNVWRKVSRWSRERKQQGETERTMSQKKKGDGTSRQGESYWFFRTSDRRDGGDERWGGDRWRRTARCEAGRARRKGICIFFHPSPVRWPSVKSSASRTYVATVTA